MNEKGGERSPLGQGLVYVMNTDAAELDPRDAVGLCHYLMSPL